LLLPFFREKTTRLGAILFFQEATLAEAMHGIFQKLTRTDMMRQLIHLYSDAIPKASRGTASKEAHLRIYLA
jgi:hypothetical protein